MGGRRHVYGERVLIRSRHKDGCPCSLEPSLVCCELADTFNKQNRSDEKNDLWRPHTSNIKGLESLQKVS